MSRRNSTCLNCGEDLGYYESDPYARSCGKPECEREARDAYRADREDREFRAMQDDYERY